MNWREQRIVAFDTETTGLEPFGGDRVIEVAAISLRLSPEGDVIERADHAWLVNPEREIPRKVTEITGITEADVAKAPRFAELAVEVHALLSDAITVAHNYPFDLGFLTMEFERAELAWPEPLAEIDTVDLSMKLFPDARSHKLGDLAERLSIKLETAHRATDDAAACGLSLVSLARRAAVGPDLQDLLDWAGAIGKPPEDGGLTLDDLGRAVFATGKLAGEPIGQHPLQLAWMTLAREHRGGQWRWRFSEPTRRWARRWLDVRAAGRARQNGKSFHASDWVIDSELVPDRPSRRNAL